MKLFGEANTVELYVRDLLAKFGNWKYLPHVNLGRKEEDVLVWKEVQGALIRLNPQIANINTGLRVLADEGQSFAFGTLSAAILIAMIPTLLVFLALQRYYVRGISEGALAGF